MNNKKRLNLSAPDRWRNLITTIATVFTLCLLESSGLVAKPVSAMEEPTPGTTCPGYYLSPQERIGINVAREGGKEITDYPVTRLGAGWYLDYTWHEQPAQPPTSAPPGAMTYMPMVRPLLFGTVLTATLPAIEAAPSPALAIAAAAPLNTELAQRLTTAIVNNPGATWLLGNEPDNRDQDNQQPSAYVAFYHTAYHLIKRLDPTAQIAIAPVTQVTPLRLRYLDTVLRIYEERYGEPLPVDVWTVHAYNLPEWEAPEGAADTAGWGIGVPPGLEAYASEALALTQADHLDLQRFVAQLVTFREWLAARGYRERPLYLTEYGILLSPHHGVDDAMVERFLLGTYAYLQGARDGERGYPADENRLVQRWAWFSLNFYAFDPDPANPVGMQGLNGQLFDHATAGITPLGESFAAFGRRLNERTVDLALTVSDDHPSALMVTNRGDAAADGFRIRFRQGNRQIATVSITTTLGPHCRDQLQLPLRWLTVPLWASSDGTQPMQIELLPATGQVEYDRQNNQGEFQLR